MPVTKPLLPASVRSYRLLTEALSNRMTEPRALVHSAAPDSVRATLDAEVAVVTMEEARSGLAVFNRRDHFKVMLVLEGQNELHYATHSFGVTRPALVFTNRLIPYSWELVEGSDEQQGFICGFTEPFLHSAMRGVSLKDSVFYKVGGNPVYYLDEARLRYFTDAFTRMRRDFLSDYAYKEDLLRNQLSIVIHEAALLHPAAAQPAPAHAADRLVTLFLRLLDIQFPITAQLREPVLKSPGDYANRLAVHVNHLNAVLKEVTGKSTSAHINERLVMEAKLLLAHTDWSVNEIAYSLGFDYPAYFTNFFKKHMGASPLAYRKDG